MHDDMGWRARLAEAAERDGRGLRTLSRAAGMSPAWLRTVLHEGASPTVEPLLRLCDALGVSAVWVLDGYEVGDKEIELLRLLRLHPAAREAVLAVLRSTQSQPSGT